MLKRSVAIICAFFGMLAIFLSGCSKNNHDTIVHFGDESYKSPVDAIYPKNYRDLWRALVPSCSDTVYDGIFPPNLMGLYEMEGIYKGGNEEIYQSDGYVYIKDLPNFPVYYGKKYLYLLIEEQQNGIAKLRFKTNYRTPINPPYNFDDWNEVDTAYIWGDGSNGSFTLCFDFLIEQAGGKSYQNGFIINGKQKIRNDVATDTINNMEFWSVIKSRKPDSDQPGIMKVGGQTMYFSNLVVKKEE